MVKLSEGRKGGGGCQVIVTLLINYYTSEVPYFLVQ